MSDVRPEFDIEDSNSNVIYYLTFQTELFKQILGELRLTNFYLSEMLNYDADPDDIK